MKQRRTKIEIINDILSAITDKNGIIKPTHLLYKSNLSHNKMKEYLHELEEKKMIENITNKNNNEIHITDRGRKFIIEYKRILEFSETFGF